MRNTIVAGNWKMNNTWAEAEKLTQEIVARASEASDDTKLILCVPFPYLLPLQKMVESSAVSIGAQDCSVHEWGAYTGEVSAAMLKGMHIPYVIIGHSERRQYFKEDGKLLAAKVDAALAQGRNPIFCCGEPLEIREQGTHEQLVTQQVTEGLFHLSAEQLSKVIIAYEPVWAIGTGKTASAQQAQDMHAVIRKHLASKYGDLSNALHILYGGSVKASNAAELFACPDVDGGLVGGASLKADEFLGIAKAG